MMRNDSNYSFPLISAEEAVQEVDVDQEDKDEQITLDWIQQN
jgi:hypothetical protein